MNKFFIFLLLLTVNGCGNSSDKSKASPTANPATSSTSGPESISNSEDALTTQYFELMNKYRIDHGAKAVEQNPDLNRIATEHSQNMATGNTSFGHSGFSYRSTLAVEALGGGNLFGEIVARGQTTPEAALNSWIKSTDHRKTLETKRYTHSGFGYYQDSDGKYYWTQIFLELDN